MAATQRSSRQHNNGMTARLRVSLAVALLVPTLTAAPAIAQQAPWATEPRPPAAKPQAQPKTQTRPAPAPSAPKDDAAQRPAPAGEAALRQRVEQLEEQLADMQVTIGTLESLGGKSSGGGAAAPVRNNGSGVDQARVDSLETQIRALTAQVEQMAEQLRRMGPPQRGEAPPVASPVPQREASLAGPRTDAGPARPVTPPRQGDAIGRILEPDLAPGAPAQPLPPAAAQAGSPKELYETAYGYLLQQDYGAAEVTFEEFLRRHPSDRLTADAQYWLGETLYVQRRFKPAGQAFLKVIEQHKASAKVPNSILKLALSLEQLGQKDCQLFAELETKHPNAVADVRTKARALKQRVGCP